MIKALLLDLDGTLIDNDGALLVASKALFKTHRRTLGVNTYEEFRERWVPLSQRSWARYVSGELSNPGQSRECMRELLAANFSDAEADAAFAPFLQTYEQAWRCYDDVGEFMQQTKGLKKIAVTNAERSTQRFKMERTGLLADIPDLVTPEDAGAWKPDPAMFHQALNQLGLASNEAMMIGDDYDKDIVPAKKLGMRTYWVRRGINDLSGALALLKE